MALPTGGVGDVVCPFHDDDSPSLSINLNEGSGLFHCKSGSCVAHTGGDAVNWLQLKGVDRKEAIKLAGKSKVRGEGDTRKRRKKASVFSTLPKADRYHEYYDDAGNKIAVVCRRPKIGDGKTKCMPFRPVKGGWEPGKPKGLMPLYGLHRLSKTGHDKRILIVEGEGDCDEWNRRFGKNTPAITCMGGSNAYDKTDWRPMSGRKCVIVSDADEAGRSFAKAVAKKLSQMDVDVQLWLRSGDDGSDVSDMLRDYKSSEVANKIKNGMSGYRPESHDEPKEVSSVQEYDLVDNNHYKMIGRSRSGIMFRERKTKAIIEIPTSSLSGTNLFRLAPLSFWCECAGTDKLNEFARHQIISGLIQLSYEFPLLRSTEMVSTGANKDPKMGVCWHLGSKVLLNNGNFLDLDSKNLGHHYEESYPVDWEDPTPSWQDHARQLSEAILRYRWNSDFDARVLIGFMGCCFGAGALDWRPNVWLVAGHGTGKTWFSNTILKNFFGDVSHYVTDHTVPYLARSIGSSSVPVIMDEFSGSPEILAFIRTNTSGRGVRGRASTKDSTSVVQTHPRCAYFISSVEMPQMRPEDSSRFAVIRLSPRRLPNSEWKLTTEAIHQATEPARLRDIRNGLISNVDLMLEAARKYKAKIDELGLETRASELYSALFAGLEMMGMLPNSDDYDKIAQGASNLSSDKQAIKTMETLLSSSVRMELQIKDKQYDEMRVTTITYTLTELIEMCVKKTLPNSTDRVEERHRREMERTLKNHGFIIREGEGTLWMHANHPNLLKLAAKNGLGRVDLDELLVQIPGVDIRRATSGQRFGSVVVKRHLVFHWGQVPTLELEFQDQEEGGF